MFLAVAVVSSMVGCQSQQKEQPKPITIKISTPPIGFGEVPGVGESESSEMLTLDDIIDEELHADISETLWQQNTYEGQVYVIPFQQLHNTLAVNKTMMIEAGLEEFIPETPSPTGLQRTSTRCLPALRRPLQR